MGKIRLQHPAPGDLIAAPRRSVIAYRARPTRAAELSDSDTGGLSLHSSVFENLSGKNR